MATKYRQRYLRANPGPTYTEETKRRISEGLKRHYANQTNDER